MTASNGWALLIPPDARTALISLPGYSQVRVLYTLCLLLAAELDEARRAA